MATEEGEKKRLQIVSNPHATSDTFQTFVLLEEEHTLGNALRYMINKNPTVTFCGYSVPHPSESRINLRIQTSRAPPTEVLKKGLADLSDACDVVLEKYEQALQEYQQRSEKGMEVDG